MGSIRTVCGDIDPASLGITYPHEHILTHPPADVRDPDLRMESEAAAISELGFFRQAGGQAIVEMTPRDYGRDGAGLRRVSEQSGVRIICVTGWHKDAFCRPWVAGRSVDELAGQMIAEIEQGIDDSGVRAGVIKAASSLDQITPAEEKVFRAAARAQQATGAAISTHTEAGTMGLEQIALLRSEGVRPERIILGHIDRRMDYAYQRALVEQGVTIIYDQIGKEKYAPDSLRVAMLARLVRDGFGKQIMLAGDLARRSYWPSYGQWGGPGLTYILWRFVPWLREHGLRPEAIDDMLIHTPARVLTLQR